MTEPKPEYLGNVTSEQVVLARDYEALREQSARMYLALAEINKIVDSVQRGCLSECGAIDKISMVLRDYEGG